FKIGMNGKMIAYISDNEFLQGYLGSPKDVTNKLLVPYKRIMDFIAGVDLLITESQYLNDEYAKKIGWGHTALSNGCVLCKLTGVKRWIVTHHDPAHDDEFLERKLLLTKQILTDIEYPVEVCHAFDGFMEYV
ncbi:MAG: phytochrome sensor protein, partial [Bacteroidota bacterium]|nr:phytochrome sensor protein [Bacteroidota bacterium]